MNKLLDRTTNKQLMINGEYVEAPSYAPLYSPYSNEKIADIAMADQALTEQAIEAAYNARKVIGNMPAFQRAEILENVASILAERTEEAATVISSESAKPIMFARAEVLRTIETYKFAAEEAKRIHGETIPFDAASGGVGRIGYTLREPIGVIAAITPFNFPMNLVAHKVGPAIAAGNPIVLKPASQTPLSALFIAEVFKDAGLPPGVLNVITGPGGVIGDVLVLDERVKMVTFTGSPSVGIGISNKAGLKKTTLELGSNSALIIDKDIDIDSIIDRCIMGAFSNQGQVCISTQRIYVHEDLYEEFTTKFAAAAKQLKLGDPLAEDTYISSLISKKELERTLSWIEETKNYDAEILAGGHAQNGVLEPTIIANADHALKVSCQEVFAPIVVVNKVDSVQTAVELVNDSRFGLQAGIYTNNVQHALYVSKNLEVGGVIINDVPTYRVDQMPYGGVKESGTGREGLKYAIEEMTENETRSLESRMKVVDAGMKTYKIAVIAGDGIGPEVIDEGIKVLKRVAELDGGFAFDFTYFPWGCEYYTHEGRMMAEDGIEQLKEFDAIYLGAVGFPGVPDHISLWDLLLIIRKSFDQYVNIRPVTLLEGAHTPLQNIERKDIDMLFIRENTEGEYSGAGDWLFKGQEHEVVLQNGVFSRKGTERIIRYAFETAKKQGRSLTSISKANALNYSMVFWDQVFEEVSAEYPEVKTASYLVDAAAMLMITDPKRFEVVVTSNLFGDILTDVGAAIAGGIGLAAGANINPEGTFPSMFEPVHGSAPDIAGKGIGNPLATIWSASQMLDHFGYEQYGKMVVDAIEQLLVDDEVLTPDMKGSASTSEVGDRIVDIIGNLQSVKA